jgi:hypothetical protein
MKKSQQHINYCLRCVADNPGYQERPLFQPTYASVQGKNVHFSSETPEWETFWCFA